MNLKSQLIIEYNPEDSLELAEVQSYLKGEDLRLALSKIMELVPSGEPKRQALLILENLEVRDLI